MATAYIAHFYPQKDAEQFFQEGEVIQVLPPIFRSFAEAAKQIGEELSDIIEGRLPVSAYVLEVEKVDGGYEVIEAIEITQDEDDEDDEEEDDFRYNNPSSRRPNAAPAGALPPLPSSSMQAVAPATAAAAPRAPRGSAAAKAAAAAAAATATVFPVGKVVGTGRGRKVEMHALDGIKLGTKRDLQVKEAADAFAAFMAARAPEGISPRLITGAYNKKAHTKAHNESLQASADARKQAIADLRPTLQEDVREGNLDQKLQAIDERIQEIQSKKKAGEIDAAAAAYDLSFENKRFEVLALLKAYCPPCAEDESKAPEELSFLRTKLRSTELKERQRAATTPMATRATASAAAEKPEPPPPPPPPEDERSKTPKFVVLDLASYSPKDASDLSAWIDELSEKVQQAGADVDLYSNLLDMIDHAGLFPDDLPDLMARIRALEDEGAPMDPDTAFEIEKLAGRIKFGNGTLKTAVFGKKGTAAKATPPASASSEDTLSESQPAESAPAEPKKRAAPKKAPAARPLQQPKRSSATALSLDDDEEPKVSASTSNEDILSQLNLKL